MLPFKCNVFTKISSERGNGMTVKSYNQHRCLKNPYTIDLKFIYSFDYYSIFEKIYKEFSVYPNITYYKIACFLRGKKKAIYLGWFFFFWVAKKVLECLINFLISRGSMSRNQVLKYCPTLSVDSLLKISFNSTNREIFHKTTLAEIFH